MDAMEHAVNRPVLCPKIIGRSPELGLLSLLVEQARGGQGHVALIAGEAGIGKSRLMSELRASASQQGFLVMQGACFPADLSYPYAPLLDLLRSLVASNPNVSLTADVKTLAQDIFPLLPELVPDQTPILPRLEPEQEKHRLFAVMAAFFLRLSTRSPLLLIIEDIHWSDDTSLDFLHYLVRRSASQPLLLLVTYRYEEIGSALSNWLAQLDRERLAHKIRLAPLERNAVDTMLSAIFEERHTSFEMRRFLRGELLDALYTLTEGTPFFVEETLGSLLAAGDIFYVQGYWNRKPASEVSIPQSIQDAVQQRTARLSEAARYVLTLAAVAGRHFDFALLQQLTRYDERQLLLLMKELVYVRAGALLHSALSSDIAIQTMAQHTLCCASVELELAWGHPAYALEIIDKLAASSAQAAEGQSSLRVLKLRGEALATLQRLAEAEAAFEAAREIARTQAARPALWRICTALGNLYQTQGRKTEAELAFTNASSLIEELAATIADESLRDNFLQQATTMLPRSQAAINRGRDQSAPTAKQAVKQAYGGLTAREREIASLIAQGKFNREIADLLVLSERTVETHVSNIMFKLNFTSRRQIARWAIAKGLAANA
jgi:predicted ATPase